ncbi:MAG TPA: CDP-alcohol phosphatidyltransferase family protein [Humibacillus xanthopallidus]|nr:CDP-alcohol phosphatidyltransferase family protein [Humibacillus xanthopallidus]
MATVTARVTPAGPLVGLAAVVGLLAMLDRLVGLGPRGWVVGLACGAALAALLSRGLVRASRRSLGPADRVTLARAVLVCAVAALVADAAVSAALPLGLLVTLSSVALALDAVDGAVARRTGTVTVLGARFDMETDAFLILVLSLHVSRNLGWWVLAIGLARYALLLVAVAARWAPWLQGQVAPRRWRKAVAAYQGIVLTAATAQVLPSAVAAAAVGAGLGLLLVSFGTEVVTLRQQSAGTRGRTTTGYAVPAGPLDDAVPQAAP